MKFYRRLYGVGLAQLPLTYERQLRSLKTYYIQTWQSY